MKSLPIRFTHVCLIITALVGFDLKALAEIAASAEQTRPIRAGQPVPDVMVKTLEGADFSLKTNTIGKLTMIVFYRGSWCPFCNRHLADVEKALPELAGLGYNVVAISPDTADGLRKMADKNHLTYALMSDPGLQAAEDFGLAFSLDEATLAKYQAYGIKLTVERNGKFCLPVPALYLIDKQGRIAFAHADPDYKKRLSGEELLKAAHELAGK
jgi:peroxiredoxin